MSRGNCRTSTENKCYLLTNKLTLLCVCSASTITSESTQSQQSKQDAPGGEGLNGKSSTNGNNVDQTRQDDVSDVIAGHGQSVGQTFLNPSAVSLLTRSRTAANFRGIFCFFHRVLLIYILDFIRLYSSNMDLHESAIEAKIITSRQKHRNKSILLEVIMLKGFVDSMCSLASVINKIYQSV